MSHVSNGEVSATRASANANGRNDKYDRTKALGVINRLKVWQALEIHPRLHPLSRRMVAHPRLQNTTGEGG